MPTLARNWLIAVLIMSPGCSRAEAPQASQQVAQASLTQAPGDNKPNVSLDVLTAREVNRHVIRNAEVTLEVKDQLIAEQKISSLAERFGGFTVSSERHESNDEHGMQTLNVELTVRIPSEKFSDFLAQSRAIAERVGRETTTSQDVTEEFIDLGARIVAERALEAQYLEILKQSKSVKDALEVHAQLAEVRERIEKAEGRKRFLENQTSLSTVHISILKFVPELRTHGFGIATSVRSAAGDVVEVGACICVGIIRVLGYLIPISLILGTPLYFGVRLYRARSRRKLARALAESTAAPD